MSIKNYTEQGGNKWVIGGILDVKSEGIVLMNGVPITRAIHQEESSASTIAELKADFNALLAKLKAAGLMGEGHG